jgi:hypothetical protein
VAGRPSVPLSTQRAARADHRLPTLSHSVQAKTWRDHEDARAPERTMTREVRQNGDHDTTSEPRRE